MSFYFQFSMAGVVGAGAARSISSSSQDCMVSKTNIVTVCADKITDSKYVHCFLRNLRRPYGFGLFVNTL